MAVSTRILLIEDKPGDVRLVETILISSGHEYSVQPVTRIDESIPILDAGEVFRVLRCIVTGVKRSL